MRHDVAVIVLAGGEGVRIGGGKPLKTLAGERLIDRALRTAASWSDQIAVAVRDPAQVEWVNAPVVTDEPEIGGPLAGLVAALRFAAHSGRELVLTIPADTPFLPADLLGRLRSEIGNARQQRPADPSGLRPLADVRPEAGPILCGRDAALGERLRRTRRLSRGRMAVGALRPLLQYQY